MIFSIGAVLAAVGAVLWLWTIKSYLDDPGYGRFDMNTAPAFDFGWFKGAVALGIGTGLMTFTWWIGVVTGIASFLTTMLVKPVLGTAVAHRLEREAAEYEASQPPKGLKALSQVERDMKNDTDGGSDT